MKLLLVGTNNNLQVPGFHCSEDESHVSAISGVQHSTKSKEDEDVKRAANSD